MRKSPKFQRQEPKFPRSAERFPRPAGEMANVQILVQVVPKAHRHTHTARKIVFDLLLKTWMTMINTVWQIRIRIIVPDIRTFVLASGSKTSGVVWPYTLIWFSIKFVSESLNTVNMLCNVCIQQQNLLLKLCEQKIAVKVLVNLKMKNGFRFRIPIKKVTRIRHTGFISCWSSCAFYFNQ